MLYVRIVLLYYDLPVLYEDKDICIDVLYFAEIIRVYAFYSAMGVISSNTIRK